MVNLQQVRIYCSVALSDLAEVRRLSAGEAPATSINEAEDFRRLIAGNYLNPSVNAARRYFLLSCETAIESLRGLFDEYKKLCLASRKDFATTHAEIAQRKWAEQFNLTAAGEPPQWVLNAALHAFGCWEIESSSKPPRFAFPTVYIDDEKNRISCDVAFPKFGWDPLYSFADNCETPETGETPETMIEAKRRIMAEVERILSVRLSEIKSSAESVRTLPTRLNYDHIKWLALWNSEGFSLSQIRRCYPNISSNAAINIGIRDAAHAIGIHPRLGVRGRKPKLK